jgi:arylsulfatase A-like enzyme
MNRAGMKRLSSTTARLVFACLLIVACSDDQEPNPDPAQIENPFLLERLDTARLYRAGELLTSPDESDASGDLRISLELDTSRKWKPMRPELARSLGLDNEALAGWYLNLNLATDDPDDVRLASPRQDYEHWQRPLPPKPFSAFYQPGGFVRQGIYLALPIKLDPRDLQLRADFRPTPAARAEHLAAKGEPFHTTDLATHAIAGEVTRPALFLTPGIEVAFPATIPQQASLRFGLATRAGRSPSPKAQVGRLHVGFRENPAAPWLFEEHVPFEPDIGREWHDLNFPLESLVGRSGEFVFELIDAEVGDRLYFVADPLLTMPRNGSDPNLLLIVVDGLRADRLDRADLTPRLRSLAASGLRFESARAAAPWTRPSISSLFTGTPPSRHGVQREMNSDVLPTDLPTLAATLRRAGYATGAFSANLHLHPAFGLDRGFGTRRSMLADANQLNELVLDWIDSRTNSPFFSFVFFMDTHYPFTHRPEHDRSSALDAELPAWGRMTSQLARSRDGAPDPKPEQLERLEALYDENVRYVDRRIGELLDELARRGLLENTLVVVTADHGEAFGEHGDLFHGWNLYDELLRVPLVVANGPLEKSGVRKTPASLTDLAASILSLLEISAGDFPGRTDLFESDIAAPRSVPIYAETRFRKMDAASIVEDGYKLIWHRQTDRLELFDLRSDPAETLDLHAVQIARASKLKATLENWLKEQDRERRESAVAMPPAHLSREEIEELRALGYLQ